MRGLRHLRLGQFLSIGRTAKNQSHKRPHYLNYLNCLKSPLYINRRATPLFCRVYKKDLAPTFRFPAAR
jgi:hypothetical protein